MQNFRSGFSAIPPVVKNLLIINFLLWIATLILGSKGVDLTEILGLHYFASEKFKPLQLVTHMFMHSPTHFSHILFNMFALWMFGRVLEQVWGPKRFFIYYFATGLGAAALHLFVNFIEFQSMASKLSPEQVYMVINEGIANLEKGMRFTDQTMHELTLFLNTPTVGASGAVFGLLLGFGVLFPNTQLMLLFPPIPIKAKYFVIGYGLLELYLGVTRPGSNVAHFAHLGGMLFGYILIKYWNKNTKNFY